MITKRESNCLQYLDDKMNASAEAVGRALFEKSPNRPSTVTAQRTKSAVNTLVSLRHKRLVTYLSDLGTWRITQAGREALKS